MDSQAHSHWLFLYNFKRIVNIACCLVTVTEKAIACFQHNHSKRMGGGGKQKSQILSCLKAVAEQPCRAVSWALQALSLIMLFESLCCSLVLLLSLMTPHVPRYLPTTNTPSWLSIREKPE